MNKIITITLNPAIDKTVTVKGLIPEKKLRCAPAIYEPGGGGVNVSRVLQRLGSESTAVFLAGGHTGSFYTELVARQEIAYKAIPIAGNTRENFTALDESTNLQYRFVMESPQVEIHEWQQCLDILRNEDCGFVVVSGSVPKNMDTAFFDELAAITKKKEIKLIADASGEPLQHLLKRGVYLAKPNLGELSVLCGKEELLPHEVIDAARTVLKDNKCGMLAVSMGAAGAMLITANEVYQAPAPAVKRRSTVGAGDSMVAGMVWALSNGLPLQQVIRYGVAAGTAATMNHGTELCRRQDVERIYQELNKMA